MTTTTDQGRQDTLVVLSIVLVTISTIAVFVRNIMRFAIVRNYGLDDWTIFVASLFTIGYLVEILILRSNHVGFPASTLTLDNKVNLLKLALAIELTYYLIVGFVKASILFLYLRFAVSVRFRNLCYATITFQLIFTVVCICVTLGQCKPLYKMWDLAGTVQGTCINTTAFFYTTSGANIITDIWIIVLPIKALKGMNRPLNEKVALLLIFGAGIFAAIMSAVRLQSIYTYTMAKDPFEDAIELNVWSMIEVNTAIICASVPALKPLFTPHRIREFRHQRKYKYRGRENDNYSPGQNGAKHSRRGFNTTAHPDTFNLSKFSTDCSLTETSGDVEDGINDDNCSQRRLATRSGVDESEMSTRVQTQTFQPA